jgi:hypothetical protein
LTIDAELADAYEMASSLSDAELLDITPLEEGLLRYCPHVPWPRQREFLDLDCREAFYGGAAGPGKQLHVEEKLYCWRSGGIIGGTSNEREPIMLLEAQAIKVGDYLIGSDGEPKQVLAKSIPEWKDFARISFDDQSSILASMDHLWSVFDLSRRAPGEKERGNYLRVLDTGAMLQAGLRYRDQNRFAIPLISGPVKTQDTQCADLPPYVLGYWLGNGCAQGSTLTTHSDDLTEIAQFVDDDLSQQHKRRVYEEDVKRGKILLKKWNQTLVAAGWPNEMRGKYRFFFKELIPFDCLKWRIKDRRQLLAGLLDSDGHATRRGEVEFDNTNFALVMLVRRLLQSLGMKPSGPRRRNVVGNRKEKHRITCVANSQLFRLKRKADRLVIKQRSKRQTRRYITSIDPVGKQRGVCFKVDAQDSLFVAGEDFIVTHNSDALLMGALQYVHVPGYAALILRKDFQRLSLSGGLIPLSHEWFAGRGPKWNGDTRRWTFASGATIQFGYLDNVMDKYRYQSSEYQYIAFDESTEFREADFKFMFSRLRSTVDIHVPWRIRCASNPGGEGHDWHLERYISDEAIAAALRGEQGIYWKNDIAFVPALIADNPALDAEAYRQNLMHLDPITRERLMHGDWSIREESLIKLDDIRRYTMRGHMIMPLGPDGNKMDVAFDDRMCRRFATIDTAGTSKEKAAETRGKEASWSVVGVWDYYAPLKLLVLRHVWRAQVDWPALKSGVIAVCKQWNVKQPCIENAHHGPPLAQELKSEGFDPKLIPTMLPGMKQAKVGTADAAKYERAIAVGLFRAVQCATLLIPDGATVAGVLEWLPAFEREIGSWTGHPDQIADQIDVCSYGCFEVGLTAQSWGGVI